MSNRNKIILLLILLGVFAGIHLSQRSGSGPAASSPPAPPGRGSATRNSRALRPIPDATLQVGRLEAPAAQPRSELRRNIFEYGYRAEPAPVEAQAAGGPATPPPPPPPPAAPVRFYGFAQGGPDGKRRVFVTDGDEVIVAAEGDIFLRRYRLLRVQNESIEVVELDGKQRWVIPLEQP